MAICERCRCEMDDEDDDDDEASVDYEPFATVDPAYALQLRTVYVNGCKRVQGIEETVRLRLGRRLEVSTLPEDPHMYRISVLCWCLGQARSLTEAWQEAFERIVSWGPDATNRLVINRDSW